MHIPDAYLSPATEAIAFVAMTPVWAIAARRTSRDLTSRQGPLLSIGAAFCFAIQMFNIPALGGTTAHALGATLLAILVGPWAALIGMTLTLAIQALLFGDGGILALGANCVDMGLVACFVGYGVYRLLSRRSAVGSARSLFAAAFGSYAGTVAASLSAGVLLGIQPLVAHDAAGHALYCPFGLAVSVPAMVLTHMLVAAPAEAILTVAALAYLWRSFPELALPNARPRVGSTLCLTRRLAWVLVLTPLGLLAGGDAWGEWDLGSLQKLVGYVPNGAARSHELVRPLLPNYGFSGGSLQVLGYLISAIVGCAAVAAFTRTFTRSKRRDVSELKVRKPWQSTIPSWMESSCRAGCGHTAELPRRNTDRSTVGPSSVGSAGVVATIRDPGIHSHSPWLESTLLKMRHTVAKTIASEEIARTNGLLQSISPNAKSIGFLFCLAATGLSQSFLILAAILVPAMGAAALSGVPIKPFAMRVCGTALFFGLVIAIPLTLTSVTPGPTSFNLWGLAISAPGIRAAEMILLRLATGITLAFLWNLTTRWHLLLRSLRSLGVPSLFLTTAALTYRYLFVMLETLAEMVEARTAREVGAADRHCARTYAGTGTAILFAKSLMFTEEMHQAMISRDAGSPQAPANLQKWNRVDLATATAGATALALIVLQGVLHRV